MAVVDKRSAGYARLIACEEKNAPGLLCISLVHYVSQDTALKAHTTTRNREGFPAVRRLNRDKRTWRMVLEAAGKELIEGCQRGERDAFRELFERHKNKVYSIALRYAGDETMAMDIAQETFL